MQRPNFKALHRLSIERVLELLGIETKKSGRQLRAPCPVCQGPSQRAFVVTPHMGLWYCFQCKEHGDGIELVSQVRRLTPYEAALFLRHHLGEP